MGPQPVTPGLVASIYAPHAVLLQPGALPAVGRQAIARTLDAGAWWCPSHRDALIVVADGNRAMLVTAWEGPRGNEIAVAEIMSFDGAMIFQHRIVGDTSAVGRNERETHQSVKEYR